MTIEVETTKLKGVLLIKPAVHTDMRGMNVTLYSEKLYKEHGIDIDFVEDKISISKKDVLRGIHGDADTWKLISCVSGKIFLAVVDCDESSPQFGQWESFELSQENAWQVLVPPKFGNGHLVLTDSAVFHYQWSAYYDLGKQFSYKYNDSRFGIVWPVKNPILSDRDKA
jgi:dTDP-4-dehydrorhamnose 3,5-epimerase